MSDAEWERLRPFLPVSTRRCGGRRDHRQVIDGILHRLRTGAQWRDPPERFGPWKTDSQVARLRKGSRGGRPPGFDEKRYKKRDTVERAINRLKQHRAIATGYAKRGYAFLGTATAAALTIWLRT
ncbi:transposase [Streptomyces syringium]|uniref:transposase n=1 Tax=Streptomyces syringium TaxID=76729 RepID=UPI003AB0E3C3